MLITENSDELWIKKNGEQLIIFEIELLYFGFIFFWKKNKQTSLIKFLFPFPYLVSKNKLLTSGSQYFRAFHLWHSITVTLITFPNAFVRNLHTAVSRKVVPKKCKDSLGYNEWIIMKCPAANLSILQWRPAMVDILDERGFRTRHWRNTFNKKSGVLQNCYQQP